MEEKQWKVICLLKEESLKRIDPSNHIHRNNPTPYTAAYFGEKLHIAQNVMFGVTHVVGVNGYSGKIIESVIMPIKNCDHLWRFLHVSSHVQYYS